MIQMITNYLKVKKVKMVRYIDIDDFPNINDYFIISDNNLTKKMNDTSLGVHN